MSEIMPISNESWFQHQQHHRQQQQRYFHNAAAAAEAQTVYPSSPTSTLSHDPITVSTQEPTTTTTTHAPPILISHKSTDQYFMMSPISNSNSNFNSKGKPIRRRSRASKKTPVTLLNADVKDFRALVQRFTGCRTSEISFSTRNRKGPVNLNFAASTHHLLPPTAKSASSEIGFNNYQHDQLPYNNFNWRTEAPAAEEDRRGILIGSMTGDQDQEHHDDMFAMNNNYNMQTSASADFQSLDDIDDLKLDDIGSSLHELIGDIIA